MDDFFYWLGYNIGVVFAVVGFIYIVIHGLK